MKIPLPRRRCRCASNTAGPSIAWSVNWADEVRTGDIVGLDDTGDTIHAYRVQAVRKEGPDADGLIGLFGTGPLVHLLLTRVADGAPAAHSLRPNDAIRCTTTTDPAEITGVLGSAR